MAGATGIPDDIRFRGQQARPGGALGIGGGGLGGVQFQVGLPTIERPPSAVDFNANGTLLARTAANTPATFPGGFQVPQNNVAAIKAISILANGLLVTSNILWTLRFNQTAVSGWNALTINPRAAGSVEVSWGPEETAIPVPEGSLIDFSVRVVDAGTYQLSVLFHGWFYSTSMAGAAAGAW